MAAFRESDARLVALALALDDVDRAGRLVDGDTRRRLTREAIEREGSEGDDWLVARARALLEPLRAAVPGIDRALRASDPRPAAAPWLLIAVLVGAATNAVGPEKAVSVLAPPLLGLVVWNLLVYAGLGLRRGLGALGPDGDRPPNRVSRWLRTLWERGLRRQRLAALGGGDGPGQQLVGRYMALWAPAISPLAAARLSRVLHLAAAAAVVGTVVGLYARGLAVEYLATWESTFLSDATVDTLVGTLLAPAATVLAPLGVEVPAASTLRAPKTGSAAPWIHLWATTAGLFVLLPRLLLATSTGARILSLRRRVEIEIPAAHRQRLLASASMEEHAVEVLTYSYRPVEKALRTLREHLLDLVGARARVRLGSTLDYGADPVEVSTTLDPRAGWRVVVFGLAQTPELEVHGELLRHCVDSAADGQRVVVVVDESAFRRRLGADAEQRVDSRRRAWRRVVEDSGLDPAFIDLVEGDADATLATLERLVLAKASP